MASWSPLPLPFFLHASPWDIDSGKPELSSDWHLIIIEQNQGVLGKEEAQGQLEGGAQKNWDWYGD